MLAGICLLGGLMLFAPGCGKKQKQMQQFRALGIEKLNQEDYQGAIEDFDRAIALASEKTENVELDVLKYRGEAEYKIGNMEAAAHTWQLLLEIEGENQECLYRLALAKAGSGQVEEAVLNYQKALALDQQKDSPIRKEALKGIAAAAEAADLEEVVVSLYREAAGDGIGDARMYNRIGLFLMEQQQYREALEYFEQAVAADESKTFADAWFNQAAAYEYLGNYQKALELFIQYREIFGFDAAAEKEITFLESR